MQLSIPFSPDQASSYSGPVDLLFAFLCVLTILFGTVITLLIIYFAIKYRRRHQNEIPGQIEGSMKLELLWSIIPFFISMGVFVWGSQLYYTMYHAPSEALEIYVVAKQWMWKFQHLDGQREINELHVPLGRKVKITMTTEDVIHSFFVPAFRVKLDVVPGKYSTVWFEATKPGRYHLFCAEYCGTGHSRMIGWIEVMEASEYQAWLAGGAAEGSLASSGEKLFQQLACITCHRSDAQGRGPVLQGLFGKEILLQNGGKVVADESYIRESILNPRAKIVAGFQPIMPTFQGQVSEEQLLQLVAYIKSIGAKPPGDAGVANPNATAPAATKPAGQ
jgi:cytochrome c oxidase subunit 2